jgi:outer membrane protein TolC
MTHCLAVRLLCLLLLLLLLAPAITPAHAADPAMSLTECISLALKENRTIKNAYLNRVVQKYTLRMAEDTFVPTLVLTPSVKSSANTANIGSTQNGIDTKPTTTTTTSLTATEKLPTGGTLSATGNFNTAERNITTKDWNINFTQPLLKNGGFDNGLESVRAAQESEQQYILNLKSTLISTLTTVITSYRTYVQAVKALEITRQSLERSRELVATNRELIAAGRMAAIEIVQSEADLANQELSLLSAENSLDAARLALTKAIDIDKNTRFTPLAETKILQIPYTMDQAKQLAFANRTDYQAKLISYEQAKRALTIAKRNRLWQLDFSSNYINNYTSNGSWDAGLTLTIPLDNIYRTSTERKTLLEKEIGLKTIENELARQREDIEIEIQNALRSAEMNYRQIKLATLARTLSEKKVEIETEKLKAGRSTNFQLVSYQNDLKNAQRSELDAIITYQNALANIDATLGVTLDKLGVVLAE